MCSEGVFCGEGKVIMVFKRHGNEPGLPGIRSNGSILRGLGRV